MGKTGQRTLALVLILLGLVMLAGNIFNIPWGTLFWPLFLIGFGLILIFRPRISSDIDFNFRPIGEIERFGEWDVKSQEFSMFVGDVDLDLTATEVPDGETNFRVSGFVSNIDLRVPPEIGVALNANAFVVDSRINGEKKDYVFTGMQHTTENYQSAAKKVRLDVACFVAEVDFKHR